MNRTHTIIWQIITLLTLFVGYSGYYICRSNLSVSTSLIVDDGNFNLTKDDIGKITSVGTLLYALGKTTNGILGDYLGGRFMFLFGMGASVCCTVLFGMGWGLPVFFFSWACNRYVQSMGWGGLVKVSSSWFHPARHALVMSFLSMSYLLGDAFARLFLGLFIKAGVSWQGIFFLAAGSLTAIFVLSCFTLRSRPHDVGADEPPVNTVNVFAGRQETFRKPNLVELVLPFLTSFPFWLVCWMNFGLTLIRETFNTWTPTYLKEVVGVDKGDAAIGSLVFPLAGGIASLSAGVAASFTKGKHGRVIGPTMLVCVVCLGVLSLLDLKDRFVPALVALACVSAFMMPAYTFCSGVLALDLGGKKGASTAAGLVDSAGYLGGTLAGWGAAAVVQYFDWQTAFAVLSGVAGGTSVGTLIYWAQQEWTHKKPLDEVNLPIAPENTPPGTMLPDAGPAIVPRNPETDIR